MESFGSAAGMLQGKTVLVTGGSRGIGAAIVRMVAAEGADVAFTYRAGTATAEQLSEELAEKYPHRSVLGVQCDVTDTEAMKQAALGIVREFGRLDVLVNNAGVLSDALLGRMNRAQWDDVIGINLGGLFNTTQPLVMQFIRQRSGSIVNLTSIVGVYGTSGQTNYAASKAGVIGFTKSLSKEIASFGVRVNAVAPGFIDTEMLTTMPDDRLRQLRATIPAGRLGTAQEVADVVCFLSSDRASYITGQVIHVDGGVVV
ncbi:MAG: beta-ketoacyl-ACP reductase [Pseudonocardiaceae bacterium]